MKKGEIKIVNKIEKSSGGLVFTIVDGNIYWLLLQDKDELVIPKGHIESGENSLEASKREIKEETGTKEALKHIKFLDTFCHKFINREENVIVKEVDFHLFQIKSVNELPIINKHSCWISSVNQIEFKYENHCKLFKTTSREIEKWNLKE